MTFLLGGWTSRSSNTDPSPSTTFKASLASVTSYVVLGYTTQCWGEKGGEGVKLKQGPLWCCEHTYYYYYYYDYDYYSYY